MYEHEGTFTYNRMKFLRKSFFEKRIVFLEGVIENSYISDPTMPWGWSTSPRGVIDQLIHLAERDNKSPITLIIDSPGGIVAYGFNLYDVMTSLGVPIKTVAMGLAASAAVPVLAAGTKGQRFIFSNSETMLHLPEAQFEGNTQDIDKFKKHFDGLKDRYVAILSRCTGRNSQEIERLMEKVHWMNAEETVSFGLADHIVSNLLEILAFKNAERDFDR